MPNRSTLELSVCCIRKELVRQLGFCSMPLFNGELEGIRLVVTNLLPDM
ncbi:hypothetical protein ANCCAN_11894, partial [Ancylostoma caninum]